MSTRTTTAAAARMGTRAGVALRTLGIPSRNPFPAGSDERAAWRRAYLAAGQRGRRRA